MKDFKALVRDTLKVKNPVGTWQLGRNMVTTKKHKSISNEDGFSYEYLVAGTVIGIIASSKDIVYLSINQDGTNEIGVVNTNLTNPTYVVKLKSSLFNFKLNCPIEGVYIYNHKNEMSVAWCDGVKTNSNTPKVANLDNPGFDVAVDGTFSNADFNKLEMFPDRLEADIAMSYSDGGNIDGSVAYVTYAYVYTDKSATPFFSINNLAQLQYENDPVKRRNLTLNFTNLDDNFGKIKVGLIIKKEGTLFGYESFDIPYIGTELVTTITSLTDYTTSSPESIILDSSIFKKMQTMTKFENKVIAANVHTEQSIDFQQYANLLEILPYQYSDTKVNAPSMLPDEVYSLGCQVQFLNGSWSENFHIPGREALEASFELNDLSQQDKDDFNLHWTDDEPVDYKHFHFFNNGNALKSGVGNRMGFWQNADETYPNESDFDGQVLEDGGIVAHDDLRGTPIRYHMMPSLLSMPIVEGIFEPTHPSNDLTKTNRLKIGVQVTNFQDVVPDFINDQIQGFRLTMVKRTLGNSYVLGNYAMTRGRLSYVTDDINASSYNFGYEDDGIPVPDPWTFHHHANRLLSPELQKFKPALNINYTKIVQEVYRTGGGDPTAINATPNIARYAKIREPLKYLPGDNLAADTGSLQEQIVLFTEDEDYYERTGNGLDPQVDIILNVMAYSYNVNLYAGFSPSNFIILGRHTKNLGFPFPDLVANFTGGDVFNDALINAYVYTVLDAFRYNRLITLRGLYTNVNTSEIVYETDEVKDEDEAEPIAFGDVYEEPYVFELLHEEDLSSIQDIVTIINRDDAEAFVNLFPFRVHVGISIPNESLTTTALRTFPTGSYYEMPNDKGEIIAVRGKERALFIQHRFTAFVASVKDKLVTDNVDAYLGTSDLFDRPPTELLSEDKGYVGCSSKFSAVIIKGMYIVVNQVTGQIFVVKDGVKEITTRGNKQWFWDNWDIGLDDFYETDINGERRRVDNPFVSMGHLVGFDKEYDRLLFTKKAYRFIGSIVGTTFDGEFYTRFGAKLEFDNENEFENLSRTLSYDLTQDAWKFEHDYFPNIMFHTIDKLFSLKNVLNGVERAKIYRHNDSTVKGLYYGNKFESYVDIIFNQRDEVSKLYQTVKWLTNVENQAKGNEVFKTITHIMLYNDSQCSGKTNLKDNHFELTRNDEGEWDFNDFRDLVIDPTLPFIDEQGRLIDNNINNSKLWFEKSNFISKFMVVRLIIDNVDNDDVHIHQVNVKSLISNR